MPQASFGGPGWRSGVLASEAGGGDGCGQECFRVFMSQGLRWSTPTRSPQVGNVPFGLDLTPAPLAYGIPRDQERVRGIVLHGGSSGRFWSQTADFKSSLAAPCVTVAR